MKRFFVSFCLFASTAFAAETFWESLTEEQRALAGVDRLTAEQRAALDALARRYVESETIHQVTEARQRAAAEVKAQVETERKSRLGFLETPTDKDVIQTRIKGDFRGWDKGTVFTLENGQTWKVEDATEPRSFSRRESAEVEIRPGALDAWKLYLLPEGLWVRVRRIK